jgi:hypothetical protein
MLQIREAQMAALACDVQERFEGEMCVLFVRAYPRECQQAGGPESMLRWVRTGTRMAQTNGFNGRREIAIWLSLMLILGADFAIDPQLPWVRELLDPDSDPDPGERLELLFKHTLDYLGKTAGKDGELVVRALLRMRAIDFASVPALDDEAAVDDACQRLRAVYPQKFAFQGHALTAMNVARQRCAAREWGLQGPGAEFLFVLLSFMLGSGFVDDPLHGWARDVLQARDGESVGGTRATRLEAAAREHLDLSLMSV